MPCSLSHDVRVDPEACYTFQYAVPQGSMIVDAHHGHTYSVMQTPLSSNPIVYESSSGILDPLAVGTVVGTPRSDQPSCHRLPTHLVGQCLVPVRDGRMPTVHDCVASRSFADVTKTYARQ